MGRIFTDLVQLQGWIPSSGHVQLLGNQMLSLLLLLLPSSATALLAWTTALLLWLLLSGRKGNWYAVIVSSLAAYLKENLSGFRCLCDLNPD